MRQIGQALRDNLENLGKLVSTYSSYSSLHQDNYLKPAQQNWELCFFFFWLLVVIWDHHSHLQHHFTSNTMERVKTNELEQNLMFPFVDRT